jgi:hypothetical protein
MVEKKNTEVESELEEQKKKNFDHDGFWKDLIQKFFFYMLKRAIPELYEAADRSATPKFLDKEFRDVLNTSDPEIHTSPHFADYVLELPLKNGDQEWILLHIEAQGSGGGNFAFRMNHYKSLIVAHFKRTPVALAILTASRPANEPSFFSFEKFGTKDIYIYNILELLELDEEELLASDNPFDFVLHAAKTALKTKEEDQKLLFLRKLVTILYERGWSKDEKLNLLPFV